MHKYGVMARLKYRDNGKVVYLRLASLPSGFKIFSETLGDKGTRLCLEHSTGFEKVNNYWTVLFTKAAKNRAIISKGDSCRK